MPTQQNSQPLFKVPAPKESSPFPKIAISVLILILLAVVAYVFRDTFLPSSKTKGADDMIHVESEKRDMQTLLARYDSLKVVNDRYMLLNNANSQSDTKRVRQLKFDRNDLLIHCKAETKAIDYLIARVKILAERERAQSTIMEQQTDPADRLHTQNDLNHIKSEILSLQYQLSAHLTSLSKYHAQISDINSQLSEIQ